MSDFADLLFQRAEQAYLQGGLAEAEGLLRMLLGRSMREAHVTYLLGHLRMLQSDPTEAEALLRTAVELDASHAKAHDELGLVLATLGRHPEAREFRLRAMELDSEIARQRMAKSFDALRKGDYVGGWEDYESRALAAPDVIPRRGFAQPQWYGETDIAGKTMLLHAEQGNGDAMQFLRYVPMVAALGAKVVLEIHRPLMSLAATVPGVADLRELGHPLPPFDLYCPLMSLPLAFRTELATIPAEIPYLTVPQQRLVRWRRRLGPRRRMRVGVAWSGNPAMGDDQFRSIPLAEFRRVLDRTDCEFHVVQSEVREADKTVLLNELPHVIDHSALSHDFADTAALISMLDLVIAVDTSVAHLSGAIGWPTWLLVRANADWRWRPGHDDSPWYPTMFLFHQSEPGVWQPVLDQVILQLDERLG
jgi:hypothetical protein